MRVTLIPAQSRKFPLLLVRASSDPPLCSCVSRFSLSRLSPVSHLVLSRIRYLLPEQLVRYHLSAHYELHLPWGVLIYHGVYSYFRASSCMYDVVSTYAGTAHCPGLWELSKRANIFSSLTTRQQRKCSRRPALP